MLRYARAHHGDRGRFLFGDASRLAELPDLTPDFDAIVFLLSLQDMEPLEAVLESAAWALRPGGRAVLLLTHPCFRVPRQSGWGWDTERQLQFRRIDHYLTPLAVPMQALHGQKGTATRSFHRPLHDYINGLAGCGLWIDRMQEIPSFRVRASGPRARAENRSYREIPLFLGLRARRTAPA
jgi:SAM-dependent methyltransferase